MRTGDVVAVVVGVGGIAVAASLLMAQRRRAQIVAQRQAGLAHSVWEAVPFGTLAGTLFGGAGTVGGGLLGAPWLGALTGAVGRATGGVVDGAWGSYYAGDDL